MIEGYVTASEDQTTKGIVGFEGLVGLDAKLNGGSVLIRRHNASGMIKNDGYVEVPVLFDM